MFFSFIFYLSLVYEAIWCIWRLQVNKLVSNRCQNHKNFFVFLGMCTSQCRFTCRVCLYWGTKISVVWTKSAESGLEFFQGSKSDPFKVLVRFALHPVCPWPPHVKTCISVLGHSYALERTCVFLLLPGRIFHYPMKFFLNILLSLWVYEIDWLSQRENAWNFCNKLMITKWMKLWSCLRCVQAKLNIVVIMNNVQIGLQVVLHFIIVIALITLWIKSKQETLLL